MAVSDFMLIHQSRFQALRYNRVTGGESLALPSLAVARYTDSNEQPQTKSQASFHQRNSKGLVKGQSCRGRLTSIAPLLETGLQRHQISKDKKNTKKSSRLEFFRIRELKCVSGLRSLSLSKIIVLLEVLLINGE